MYTRPKPPLLSFYAKAPATAAAATATTTPPAETTTERRPALGLELAAVLEAVLVAVLAAVLVARAEESDTRAAGEAEDEDAPEAAAELDDDDLPFEEEEWVVVLGAEVVLAGDEMGVALALQ